jgi:hypothetical protein
MLKVIKSYSKYIVIGSVLCVGITYASVTAIPSIPVFQEGATLSAELLNKVRTAIYTLDTRTDGHTPTANDHLSNKGYTDTQDTTNLTAAKSYADSKDATNLTAAKSYADSKDATNLTAAKSYADSKDATNLTAAKSYADSKDATNLTAAKSYADSKDATNLTAAKSYADSKDATNLTAAKSYADSKDATNLTAAKSYADSKDATNLTAAKSYADSKDATNLTAAKSYADSKDATNLTAAKSYADSKDTTNLTAAKTHADTGDTNTLNSAKSYADANDTDTRVSLSDSTTSTSTTVAASSKAVKTLKDYVDTQVAASGGGSGEGVVNAVTGVKPGSVFRDANITCANLTEGGHSDWRLPTMNELTYAVYSISNPNHSGVTDYLFTRTMSPTGNYYWILFRPSDAYWKTSIHDLVLMGLYVLGNVFKTLFYF